MPDIIPDDWQDNWDEPYFVEPDDPEKKSQDTLTLEPEYDKQDGIKFEFTGTLMIPAPGEMERLEREKPSPLSNIAVAEPALFVRKEVAFATRNDFRKVKMNGLAALRLRQRGA